MKWTPSGFGCDVVEFTWLDLLKLALGKKLKMAHWLLFAGALHEQPTQPQATRAFAAGQAVAVLSL